MPKPQLVLVSTAWSLAYAYRDSKLFKLLTNSTSDYFTRLLCSFPNNNSPLTFQPNNFTNKFRRIWIKFLVTSKRYFTSLDPKYLWQLVKRALIKFLLTLILSIKVFPYNHSWPQNPNNCVSRNLIIVFPASNYQQSGSAVIALCGRGCTQHTVTITS